MWRPGLLDHRGINPRRVAETVLEGRTGSRRSPPDSVITSRGKPDMSGRGAEIPPAETSPAGVTNPGPAAEREVRVTTDRASVRNAGDVMPPERRDDRSQRERSRGRHASKGGDNRSQRERSRGRHASKGPGQPSSTRKIAR